MLLELALLFDLLIVIFVYFFAWQNCIPTQSAVAIACLFGLLFLQLFYPYYYIARRIWPTSSYVPQFSVPVILYLLLMLFFWIYLIFYIYFSVVNDRVPWRNGN